MVLMRKKVRLIAAVLVLVLIYTKMAPIWDLFHDWTTVDNKCVTFVVNHAALCDGTAPLQLLIMVISSPTHYDARNAIRETWGGRARRTPGVRMAFMLGLPTDGGITASILSEDEAHGDVVQGDFVDAYGNLTVKSVAVLQWIVTHCPRARFLLKIDDDCFLHVPHLLEFLTSRPENVVAIYGRLLEGRKPDRNVRSKWYLSESQYPHDDFPPFVSGPSYVYTRDAVPVLYSTVPRTKPQIHLEDVYLNGLVAEKAGVPRIGNDDFSLVRKSAICQGGPFVSVHGDDGLAPHQIRELWRDVESNNLCGTCRPIWVTFLNKMRHRNIGAPMMNVRCS